MCLTGTKIVEELAKGGITISPFRAEDVGPNSYDYRLGPKLQIPVLKAGVLAGFKEIILPPEGYVIEPNTMYLGHTYETLGSRDYAMSLTGRSSLGRLGLMVQVDADLGHTGSCHCWTLEIVSALPFKLYPFMPFGQISFWANQGRADLYTSGYSRHNGPQPSKFMSLDTNHL